MSNELEYKKSYFENGMRLDACYLCNIDDGVEKLFQEISDMKYVPIKFTSISNNINTAEIGRTINTVTINWALNKEPIVQYIGEDTIPIADRSVILSGLSITNDTSFLIKVMDERKLVVSASTGISFSNGIYYGAIPNGADIDSNTLLTLDKKLQKTKSITFTATASNNQRVAYALPSRYGTPKFNIGGFDYEWDKIGTISFTNIFGYTEDYDVWASNINVGTITVKVS